LPVAAGEKVARHFASRVDRRHDCLRHVNVVPVELSQCGLVFALMTLELGLVLPLKARTR
jgi:hypothetical protein